MVVGYFRIELARSLSFLSGHKDTVSRAFINVLLQIRRAGAAQWRVRVGAMLAIRHTPPPESRR